MGEGESGSRRSGSTFMNDQASSRDQLAILRVQNVSDASRVRCMVRWRLEFRGHLQFSMKRTLGLASAPILIELAGSVRR